jgi:antitoxin VapB
MSNEHSAKVFKSGNSVALRLPKALGIEEGTEMRIREERGRFVFEPVNAPERKIDVSKFRNAGPDLAPLAPEERAFEVSPRDWHLLEPRE